MGSGAHRSRRRESIFLMVIRALLMHGVLVALVDNKSRLNEG